ncbi:hypothetical protein FDZ74_01435 [bacterium]|nr:MAG: hypothetical protein FDZ74_01435 [bacterium]
MEFMDFEEKKRLIVLLPESLAGSTKLAHQINWMAGLKQYDVLYLTLVEDETNPLEVSRRMATMVAATVGEPLHVSSKMIPRDGWLNALRETFQPGDSLVCQAEQSVKAGFLKAVSMQDYLQEALQIHCQTISGYYHPAQDRVRQWLLGLLFWVVCLAILIGFSLLEVQIDRAVEGVARIALLLLTVSLEFGALIAWNRLPKI